ncbi:hypothetical protein LDENG_00205240 [Lucifuga dentata]|nr:hypothetical protein LDENG_00205240 [Lucifuga dentata]
MMLSLKQREAYQILRHSEIHVHFSKIQLFTQIVQMIISCDGNSCIKFKKNAK